MIFWKFLLHLGVIWQLVAVPAVQTPVVDYNSELNQVNFTTAETKQLAAPIKEVNDSVGIKLSAKSAILADWQTGQILWRKDSQVRQPIASLTKLMTALVFLEFNPGWETDVVIRQDDYRQGGMFYLFQGEKVNMQDLFHSVLIASDNNAAVALARSTGMSLDEFVTKMNEKAQQMDMQDTHFVEPTGLQSGNLSTVHDLLKLVRAAFANPDIKSVVSQQEYSYEIINTGRVNRVHTTNDLLSSYLQIIAGKTGYSAEAGGCLSVVAQNSDGHKLVGIVLGSDNQFSRFDDMKALIQWGFDNYYWPEQGEGL